MKIDCGTCSVRPVACADCVVTFLTIPIRDLPPEVDLDAAERAAIAVLASSGLVPPLRLTQGRRLRAANAPPGASRTG